MAKFDQRHQQVVNQTNADTVNQVNANSVASVNFGSTQSKVEFIAELRKLIEEIEKASNTGAIEKKIAVDVEFHIKKAVVEIEEPHPQKKNILDHIASAKTLLEGLSSATGLVNALMQAAKIAGGLFL